MKNVLMRSSSAIAYISDVIFNIRPITGGVRRNPNILCVQQQKKSLISIFEKNSFFTYPDEMQQSLHYVVHNR